MSLTIPFYACVLVGNIAITGYAMEHDESIHSYLPKLYLINILNLVDGSKKLVAGQFIRTSKAHTDADFAETIHEAAALCPPLLPFLQEQVSFLPSAITVSDGSGLSENEMKRLFFQKCMVVNSTRE